ncbi:F-box only protein 43 [Myripristis murdjan]|uniref:F-box only protein 43 n=1 Tax=Myripristis murdjan TaxID=586833 RepID=UPI001175E011|nr:F-box only protein 43 [Myripristis murdjan]
MNCTPDLDVYPESCKNQLCYGVSFDSGYSGLFNSPRSASGTKYNPRWSLSSEEFNETPKENLQLSVTPKKERTKEPVRSLDKDFRGLQQPLTVGWCETPKLTKRDATLRRRLLTCKSVTDVKTDSTRSPYTTKRTECSCSVGSELCFSACFDSPDTVILGTLASSTLKSELDVPLSGGKRRLLFSQVRTSTLQDGKHNSRDLSSFERKDSLSDTYLNESIISSEQLTTETPCLRKLLPALSKENPQTPVNSVGVNLCESLSVLNTPSFTPKYNRSVSEDSGFSSLTLDKSQDSSVDHDGSFQELLLSASKGNCETPNPAEIKRRSRLQRQHRLSTLKEGGSQSEEDIRNISQVCTAADLTERNNEHSHHCHSVSKEDDVFGDNATPLSATSGKLGNAVTPLGRISMKQDYVTPHRSAIAKQDNITPCSTASTSRDVTPLRKAPVNLSLTPALQLVHAMCQRKAQMLLDQSPSLEEQLKSAASLAETPVTLKTTMPLSGLIGRKMGLGQVDILTELKKRNLRHILAVILGQLSSEDVYSVGQVCKSWNEIIQQDKQASHRRRLHLNEVEAALELGGAVHVPDAETRLTLLRRSVLKSVQAQSRTSSYCTPQSGKGTLTPLQHSASHSGSSSKRDKFLQIAKTLFNDECLKACPRCQHPARCHSVKREAVCSRIDCSFQFCTACLCAFHGSRECGSHSAIRRNKKDTLLPGSAQSKRNLRRL